MELPKYLRASCSALFPSGILLGWLAIAGCSQTMLAQIANAPPPASQTPTASQTTVPMDTAKPAAQASEPAISKRQLRHAQDAYLAGAKKLTKNDLTGAEEQFVRAQTLDPDNREYSVALALVRQHRLTELVQQASKQRQAGDAAKAAQLMAEARAIDPENPIVIEHDGLQEGPNASHANDGNATTQKTGAEQDPSYWHIQAPEISGAIRLLPSDGVRDLHLDGISADVLRDVAAQFGIRAVIDNSVQRLHIELDLEKVNYRQAMSVLTKLANVFPVPLDERSVLFAKDNPAMREQMQRQMEETIFLPGATPEQVTEISNVARNIFAVQKVTVQPGSGSIVLRAPEDVLGPMNTMLTGLLDNQGEVMIEVKLYEVDTTHDANTGADLPTGAGIFNVNQAAASLVSANESLVQQGIAQGLIHSTDSNLTIAGALIAYGLVQSSLLSSTIGVVGGGAFMTGITETGSVGFNFGLNSSNSRSLDDVVFRVGDRQDATFREGTKYPIVTSNFSTGISSSSLPAAAANATIGGVSVSKLLSQFSSSNVTVPQVTYEDLGITLKATPMIQKSGRVSMKLDLKIESLAGSSINGNPVLNSRAMSSEITVGEGESALLVSSVSQTETAAMNGIPGLSELPGFQLPETADLQKNTSRLVLEVTPHIVRRRSQMVTSPRIQVRGESGSE